METRVPAVCSAETSASTPLGENHSREPEADPRDLRVLTSESQMFNSIIAWFDARYSPVALAGNPHPPMGLRKFLFYFIQQFRTAFLIRMVLVAIGSIADAMLPIFVGLVVGFLATTKPGEMFTTHWQTMLVMVAVVALV